jgi:hypothetical protein
MMRNRITNCWDVAAQFFVAGIPSLALVILGVFCRRRAALV